MTGRASLYDVAPRLAVARRQRQWELAVIDGLGFKVGDEFAEILTSSYRTDTCRLCGGTVDEHRITDRLLVGSNKGHVGRKVDRKCRRCGHGSLSSR